MESEMPSYILKATGAIRYNRRNVGRVVRATSGLWVAEIGRHRVVNADKSTAFREVVALAAGFSSSAAMRAHNAGIRRQNAANRAAVRSAWRNQPPARVSRPTPEMIEGIQQGAIAVGETPLTVEQILASWRA
jgi:hypothetical protein